jgi:hypothetical protein
LYRYDKGFFISVMMSGPLLCILIVVLVNFLLLMTGMMVKAKRAELKQKYGVKGGKKKAAAEGGGGDGGKAGEGAGAAAVAKDTKKDK